MNKRSSKLFIDDIITSINSIEEYIEGIDYEKFIENKMLFDAVIRNLEIIGEAVKKIPDNIKAENTDIPWKNMAGLRDIVAHEYFGIDESVIWEIITKNIPDVKDNIVKISEKITD